MATVETAAEKIEALADGLAAAGCDWAHDYDGTDPDRQGEDARGACAGEGPEVEDHPCRYCVGARRSMDGVADLLHGAAAALRAGDVGAARRLLCEAATEEWQWGDAPAAQQAERILEDALEEEEESAQE